MINFFILVFYILNMGIKTNDKVLATVKSRSASVLSKTIYRAKVLAITAVDPADRRGKRFITIEYEEQKSNHDNIDTFHFVSEGVKGDIFTIVTVPRDPSPPVTPQSISQTSTTHVFDDTVNIDLIPLPINSKQNENDDYMHASTMSHQSIPLERF